MDPTNETAGKAEAISAGRNAMRDMMVRVAQASHGPQMAILLRGVVATIDEAIEADQLDGFPGADSLKGFFHCWCVLRAELLSRADGAQIRADADMPFVDADQQFWSHPLPGLGSKAVQ